MSDLLVGKVAIVTGASRGIGRAIALELARVGAKLVVNYASSSDAADKLVTQIVDAGGEAISICADVSKANQIDASIRPHLSGDRGDINDPTGLLLEHDFTHRTGT